MFISAEAFIVSADELFIAVRGVLVKLNLLFNKSLNLGLDTLVCAVIVSHSSLLSDHFIDLVLSLYLHDYCLIDINLIL